jgi:Tfp pilus assembly protein PilF
MKQFLKILSIASMLVAPVALSSCSSKGEPADGSRPSTKRERNYMKDGKNLFDKQRYAEAEVSFKKALGENPENGRAQFNLASSYLKQRGEDLTNKGDSLIQTADKILSQTASSTDVELAEQSFYDRGNVAYKSENYAAAIEMYKNALRRNPQNNQARENLRLAQLKKQQQDQNKDNNQNQNQDQNQDQNKDQNKDQQQQQQQDQNQDQNKDKNKDQNQDQNQQQQQQNQDQQQKQQQQQGGLSEQSAAQILKAMDDKESATRMKVEQMKQGQEKQARQRTVLKPW